MIIDLDFDARTPRGVEAGDPGDCREEIDAIRGKADLDHGIRSNEVVPIHLHVLEWRAEARQRLPHPIRIFRRWIQPDVQILGRSRHPLNGQGVRSDDEEPSARVPEGNEDVRPVARHSSRVTRTGISCLVYVGNGRPVSRHARSVSSRTISSRSEAVVVSDRSSRGSDPSR